MFVFSGPCHLRHVFASPGLFDLFQNRLHCQRGKTKYGKFYDLMKFLNIMLYVNLAVGVI